MGMKIIIVAFIVLSLFNIIKWFVGVYLRKSQIEKELSFSSWVLLFFLILGVVMGPIIIFNFLKEHNTLHIVYFISLILFCGIYIFTYRKIYCFNEYFIIAGKRINYKDLTEIEVVNNRGKVILISISTKKLFMNIKLNQLKSSDFLAYISTKIKFKILTK